MSVKLEVVGYFQFACGTCNAVKQCVFGCGRDPRTICDNHTPDETQWIPLIGVEGEQEFICEYCGELF